MGMFDTIRSSIDLGPSFWYRDLQTKDLECLMNEYWISPSGQLYEIDYSHTADFVEFGEDDPRYDPKRNFLNFGWIPNGQHGRVRPVYITRTIEVYPCKWECHYAPFPRINITFIDGVLRK